MVYAQAPGPLPSPTGRAKRPMWHWLLLGGVTLFCLLLVAVFAVFIAFKVFDRGDPQTTIDDFYSSLESTDCELFEDSTTEEFREITGLTSCSVFEENLGGITEVDYRVDDRINRQGYAIFEVTEIYSQDGQDMEVELRYYVRRIDGQWDLDGIEVLDESSQPIT